MGGKGGGSGRVCPPHRAVAQNARLGVRSPEIDSRASNSCTVQTGTLKSLSCDFPSCKTPEKSCSPGWTDAQGPVLVSSQLSKWAKDSLALGSLGRRPARPPTPRDPLSPGSTHTGAHKGERRGTEVPRKSQMLRLCVHAQNPLSFHLWGGGEIKLRSHPRKSIYPTAPVAHRPGRLGTRRKSPGTARGSGGLGSATPAVRPCFGAARAGPHF